MKTSQLPTLLFIVLIAFLGTNCSKKNNEVHLIKQLTSPDKSFEVDVFQSPSDTSRSNYLFYKIALKTDETKTVLIEPSILGLTTNDDNYFSDLQYISSDSILSQKKKYIMYSGKRRFNIEHYDEFTLHFKSKNNNPIDIIFRLYNEGLGMRYSIPTSKNRSINITKECTAFRIPDGSQSWIQPYAGPGLKSTSYEHVYTNGTSANVQAPQRRQWAFPALFKINSSWILLSESDLGPDYCGTHLAYDTTYNSYQIRFPFEGEVFGRAKTIPQSSVPWLSPWRTIIIAKSPGGILESNLIHHLATPTSYKNLKWIKPGKSSWSWWSDSKSSKNYKSLKNFVDLAVSMKWKYTLIDANWNIMNGGNIKELVEYANSKNIGPILWYNSGGPHNKVQEQPRNIMDNAKIRQQEFKKLQEWGVKGVKVDFFESDKQPIIKLYHDILQDAMKFKLLVVFHGCTLPRGWSKTYPNLMSMEAVRGAEFYKFREVYPKDAVVQNSILPFTRNVTGPMDYTPVTFSNHKYPHLTTKAHELALSVVFESGIQHFADKAEEYLNLPLEVKNLLANVPVSWDDIRYIDGYPGRYLVLARRTGDDWYVAAINSENKEIPISFRLNYLKFGKYKKIDIQDDEELQDFIVQESDFTINQEINMTLKPYGGFVSFFHLENNNFL